MYKLIILSKLIYKPRLRTLRINRLRILILIIITIVLVSKLVAI